MSITLERSWLSSNLRILIMGYKAASFSLLLLLGSVNWCSASAPPLGDSRHTIETIFAQNYWNWFIGDEKYALRGVLGNASATSRNLWAPHLRRRAIQLSVKRKTLLAVTMALSLPFDGELGETFGDFLGQDAVEVAGRLHSVPTNDYRDLCHSMGYPNVPQDDRPEFLLRKIQAWSRGDQCQIGTPVQSPTAFKVDAAAEACETIFANCYLQSLRERASKKVKWATDLETWTVDWGKTEKMAHDLPIKQKCRLTLLLWLSLPSDSSAVQHYKKFWLPQKEDVLNRLTEIKPITLEKICRKMGYPICRVSALERDIHDRH